MSLVDMLSEVEKVCSAELWMSLVGMLPIQRWISSGQRGVYCEPTDGAVRLRKCAVQ